MARKPGTDWSVMPRDFQCPSCGAERSADAGRIAGTYGRRRCLACGLTWKIFPLYRMVHTRDSSGKLHIKAVSWSEYLALRTSVEVRQCHIE